MLKKEITILNVPEGEVSMAALVVQRAGKFNSSIYIEKDGRRVNGKSIMGVMTMPFAKGETLTITAEGPDEQEAIDSMENFLVK